MTPPTTHQGTIALVTGGNKGIGLQIVEDLAKLGMTVYLAARDEARGEEAVAKLTANKLDVRFVQLDVTDVKSVASVAAHVGKESGPLDVLVNNAGIANTTSPKDATLEDARRIFETNVFGVIAVTRGFQPLIEKSKAGRIVNVSSSLGSLTIMSNPPPGFAQFCTIAYSASKTALNGVTIAFANELLEKKIKVNAACPGYTATDLNGHSGPRTVQQGAKIEVHLATLPDDGPTGAFFDDAGPVAW
jgi:NAD(P)-dependent dehydrogenase (short-subunit alcohol dehydrogenase family)